MTEDERIYRCPKCDTVGTAIHEVDDKSKILYSDGLQTLYAKKLQCANCGAEWSKDGLLLNGIRRSESKEPSSDDIVFAFITSLRENHLGEFETFSDDVWKYTTRYFLTKQGMIENDSSDVNYLQFAEFMDFIETEVKKRVENKE
ncbi:MAG: hypothetical protein JW776_12775 [Candidatus Lokiarchaeota archaeon]|nr:hypothetical protein [Candidatus Lokiarchaeota archaeon]